MAFTINKTDGTVLTTIADGTVDSTTSLSLIGKNYAGYGEILNENQVKLLENFANTTANAPSTAIKGQLFFDTTLGSLQVYDGSAFKTVSGSLVSATQPTNGVTGDLWYDSNNKQIYAYDGSNWILVGPTATSGEGTSGSIVASITDSTGASRSVIQLTVQDVIVAMVADTEFTPETAITGFSLIKKGITLSTNISSNKFQGTASDSDALGGVAAASYLRSDNDDTSVGTLTIQKDASLVLGADGDLTVTQSGANTTFKNVTSDGNILFNVNDGGSDRTAMTVTGEDASVTMNNNLTVSGDLTVSGTTTSVNTTQTKILDPIIHLNSGASSPDNDIGLLFDRGGANQALIWDESADEFAFVATSDSANTYGDISIDSYATIHATATAAQYADLAERYEADTPMEYGDVVKIGGEKEITKTTQEADTDVFGVVAKDPAFKMNTGAGDDITHPYVSLSGRTPCKVLGAVKKGDRLITSDTPGVAKAVDSELPSVYTVIGRSLEDNDALGVKYVEITVGKN